MDNTKLLNIAHNFDIEGEISNIEALGEGFINDTYIVTTEGDAPNYILQRKNHNIFPDVPAMMNNIGRVTRHLKAKVDSAGGDAQREVLTVIPTKQGELYHKYDEEFWAMSLFIEESITHNKATSPRLAYMGGKAIGRFQSLLADFNEPLAEVIKGFHNIRWRFEQWDSTLAEDRVGRAKEVATEIEWIESRRETMLSFWQMVEEGKLPLRVTHNDTKLSNILFDKPTGKVLCAIDLDTVMSSTSLNDFGDAIRSYTNTGAEDDKCLENVEMDINMFRAYAEGYLSEQLSTMSESELEWLAFAGRYITFEQVLRFLMDYIDGDKYYKIAYPDHNLVRTRAQYKLLQSMERQYPEMQAVIREIKNS